MLAATSYYTLHRKFDKIFYIGEYIAISRTLAKIVKNEDINKILPYSFVSSKNKQIIFCLSVCLSVRLSVCLSVCLSVVNFSDTISFEPIEVST